MCCLCRPAHLHPDPCFGMDVGWPLCDVLVLFLLYAPENFNFIRNHIGLAEGEERADAPHLALQGTLLQ